MYTNIMTGSLPLSVRVNSETGISDQIHFDLTEEIFAHVNIAQREEEKPQGLQLPFDHIFILRK